MKDIKWLVNRLKAMGMKELLWRIQQKQLQNSERKLYFKDSVTVTDVCLPNEIASLQPDIERIKINWNNDEYTLFSELSIFNIFSYDSYKKEWNAGFQTKNKWSENDFSYDINCSHRVDIGDIRTNWELNRHYQFAALAKSFYITGDTKYLIELKNLFEDWNIKNLFLHGVEWISAMEIAIRVNSWVFTYCFLSKGFQKNEKYLDQKILNAISHGILVMVDYITKHYSRFSSANNHLIVEAYSIGLAGIFYNYQPWIKLSIKILTDELPNQNYSDGVNKEMSLHYQSFVMEAYGMLIHMMNYNGIKIPELWYVYLQKMSSFLANCTGDYGETVVFGDNDEGKILDLDGKKIKHYHYVLDLMGCVLEQRFTDLEKIHENLCWLFSKEEICNFKNKKVYEKPNSTCYREGGYTILRSKNHKILIVIDHADLGFGTIAAHGHADALSFQLYYEGRPVFVDAGTYNYHITPEKRNIFRSTYCHNTVTISKQNQSEILGPFLWGKRADCKLLEYKYSEKEVIITAEVNYFNIKHIRTYKFNYCNKLSVEDCVIGDFTKKDIEQIFLLGKDIKILENCKNQYNLSCGNTEIILKKNNEGIFKTSRYEYSESYGEKIESTRICCLLKGTNKVSMKSNIIIK